MTFVIQFNSHTVAPNVAPEALPTGEYPVWITDTKETLVQNGNGAAFYEMIMAVLDGEFKGRKHTERLNVKNPNTQTVEIAYATLSSICCATGIRVLQQSSAELHHKPFRIAVVKEPRNDDPTKFRNRVVSWMNSAGEDAAKIAEGGGDSGTATSGFDSTATTTQQTPSFAQQAQTAQTTAPINAQTAAAQTTAFVAPAVDPVQAQIDALIAQQKANAANIAAQQTQAATTAAAGSTAAADPATPSWAS